jgi:hypothetical protein
MRDTSNIRPIAEHLSRATGQSLAKIQDKLDIGRLYGARCSLVHDGKLPVQSVLPADAWTRPPSLRVGCSLHCKPCPNSQRTSECCTSLGVIVMRIQG